MARAYFGQPPGGLRFFRDFLMAACQSPWTFRNAGLGPGLAFGLLILGLDGFSIRNLRKRLNDV